MITGSRFCWAHAAGLASALPEANAKGIHDVYLFATFVFSVRHLG